LFNEHLTADGTANSTAQSQTTGTLESTFRRAVMSFMCSVNSVCSVDPLMSVLTIHRIGASRLLWILCALWIVDERSQGPQNRALHDHRTLGIKHGHARGRNSRDDIRKNRFVHLPPGNSACSVDRLMGILDVAIEWGLDNNCQVDIAKPLCSSCVLCVLCVLWIRQ
jgi:hypothetical protein